MLSTVSTAAVSAAPGSTISPKRSVRRGHDPKDGAPVVFVQLAKGAGECRMFEDDYNKLMAFGLSPNWCFNASGNGARYVRAGLSAVRGKLVTVARVLTGAGAGERVRYLDWDHLNLRSDNLYFTAGKAGRNDAALVAAVTLPESMADASRAENGCEPVAQHCDLHHELVRQVLVLLNLQTA